jgi:hypothetical protein
VRANKNQDTLSPFQHHCGSSRCWALQPNFTGYPDTTKSAITPRRSVFVFCDVLARDAAVAIASLFFWLAWRRNQTGYNPA